MANNKDDDFAKRVANLKGELAPLPSDAELASRFEHVFSSAPTAADRSYDLTIGEDEVDRLLAEVKLDGESDEDDDYLADILSERSIEPSMRTHPSSHHLDAVQAAFLDNHVDPSPDDTHELLNQIKDQVAVESKYEKVLKTQDDDMEKRYLALKSTKLPDNILAEPSKFHGPRGSVPKPLEVNDLYDEVDDWCCICNDDATLECADCDKDKFCRQCFHETHLSDDADYGFNRHMVKTYTPMARRA
ncbi:hypothetical protein BC940DRAFT_311864 [Gongronella butleri]|nr:hypothetical protein BC940DRAFT_311855 [Gongronella butleri]KAI8060562.1 hypothetical protein BC940DRAFT_311864 [Gongronella butleri]